MSSGGSRQVRPRRADEREAISPNASKEEIQRQIETEADGAGGHGAGFFRHGELVFGAKARGRQPVA